jgi:hypothetical protein
MPSTRLDVINGVRVHVHMCARLQMRKQSCTWRVVQIECVC